MSRSIFLISADFAKRNVELKKSKLAEINFAVLPALAKYQLCCTKSLRDG